MKRTLLLTSLLIACVTIRAQWVDDPRNNTFIANCESSAAEVKVITNDYGNDGVFVQWTSMSENGWSPKLQYLDYYGVPQWGPDGVHITTPNLATWSPGYAIAALADRSVVTMFRTADAHHWVVKVNEDGSTPWGTDGMMLFDGAGGGRSELLAGDDGGFWALGTDMDNSFLQYVNADGSLRPMATISDPNKICTNGKLVPTVGGVFVVYAKQTIMGYSNYNKEIYVAKYNKDGDLLIPEMLLLGQQTVGMSYIHYAVSDGWRGGYVYQWHNGIGGVYNIYVTHFDEDGNPTNPQPNGTPVHLPDPTHYYLSAYATVNYQGNLILAYRQTDAATQSVDKIYMNCITETGEALWGDGILVADALGSHYYAIMVDAFDYEGFAVIYGTSYNTIEATGYDYDAGELWSTMMSTSSYDKTIAENTTGYHSSQNVVVWVNANDGGLYGQNIGTEGEMGEIVQPGPPPIPCCYEPENFSGSYYYDEATAAFGALLSWEAPAYNVLHYNLYRQQLDNGIVETIEIDGDTTSYFDEINPGTYKYQLTAVYEDSESGFAFTPDGEDYLILEVTSVPEDSMEEITNITKIYTTSGQLIRNTEMEALSQGIYIVHGWTANGKYVTRKVIKN